MSPRQAASIKMDIPDFDRKIKVWKTLAPKAFERGLEAGIRAATIVIQARVKNLIDGPVLNRRTGRLWRSIQPEVFKKHGRVVGIVGTDVKYAAVHEFGAIIRPKKEGGRLVFRIGDSLIFAKQVEIPQRPFMSRGFKERRNRVKQEIQRKIMKSVKGTLKAGKILPISERRGVGFADSG